MLEPTAKRRLLPHARRRGPRDELAAPLDAELVEADLLVEDVSIDGMCGVY